MSQIEITCIDQTAIYTNTPEIFSGDVNVDTVKFIFDDSWNAYTNKTAIFYNDSKKVYPQILNENNIASIPKEVIANKCKLSIGVIGTNANGDIKTSKILTYNIGKGAISDDLESSTATPDIWLQILTQIEELKIFVDKRQELMEAQITQKQDDFEAQITHKQDLMQSQVNNILANQPYVYALNDTVSDEYVSASTLPYDFYYGSAVILNDEIHILGGNGSNSRKHYKWDGTNWISASTLPYDFYYGSAVILNDEIHILGGNGSNSRKHYKWDGTNWSSASTLIYEFYYGSAVILNDEIHILGSNGSDSIKHYKWDGTNWSSVSVLPHSFTKSSAVILNDEIHILGGNGSNSRKHYKWDGTNWISASTLPYDFYYGSAVILNDEIHILGSNGSDSIKHYKWNGTNWSSVSVLPHSFTKSSAVILNDEIHILGGNGSNSRKHYKFGYFKFLSGYVKANMNVYLPIPTKAYTDNLEVINNGYRVTEDGYIKILIE